MVVFLLHGKNTDDAEFITLERDVSKLEKVQKPFPRVHYDDAVWQGVRQRRLFAAASPTCRASGEVAQLARNLLQAESLALAW